MARSAVKNKADPRLDKGDGINIKNLFTNSIIAHVEDRAQVLQLINDEAELGKKLLAIQKERDEYRAENEELKKSKKSNGGKASK